VLCDDHKVNLPVALADLKVGEDPGGHAARWEIALQTSEKPLLARDVDWIPRKTSTVLWLFTCAASGGDWKKL
jgi:hypothetical protein